MKIPTWCVYIFLWMRTVLYPLYYLLIILLLFHIALRLSLITSEAFRDKKIIWCEIRNWKKLIRVTLTPDESPHYFPQKDLQRSKKMEHSDDTCHQTVNQYQWTAHWFIDVCKPDDMKSVNQVFTWKTETPRHFWTSSHAISLWLHSRNWCS